MVFLKHWSSPLHTGPFDQFPQVRGTSHLLSGLPAAFASDLWIKARPEQDARADKAVAVLQAQRMVPDKRRAHPPNPPTPKRSRGVVSVASRRPCFFSACC